MEPKIKKLERFARYNLIKLDYFLFHLFRLFRKPKKINKQKIKKILVVEQTFLGDIITTTPVYKELKRIFPNAKISLMLFENFKDLVSSNPNIDEIIGTKKEVGFKDFKYYLKFIKSKKFDMVLILHHGTFWNSLLFYLSNIPYRIGCTKTSMLKPKGYFLTHKIQSRLGNRHVVEQNLDTIRIFDEIDSKDKKTEIFFGKEDSKFIDEFFEKNKIKKGDIKIAIHPGSKWTSHVWFNDKFAKVADYFAEKYNAKIIFTGDATDLEKFIKPIQNQMKNKSYHKLATLKQCAALLSECNLLLSIDTGMAHIGDATGIPVIGLYGSGKPATWAPWNSKHLTIFNDNAKCTSCRRKTCNRKDYICMRSITEKQVINQVEKVIKK